MERTAKGGDKSHTNGVHFEKDARGKAIKTFVNETLKPELKLVLQGEDLFQGDSLAFASATHAQAMAVIDEMHELPVQATDDRSRLYRDGLLASEALCSLTEAMDLWAACWFWPADEIDAAPSPRAFSSPSVETRKVARRIAKEMRFFHWELEFPDVFCASRSGFDAMTGNPPWENLQPNPEEFFSNADPLFRTYTRTQKMAWQRQEFANHAAYELQWIRHVSTFKCFSNWVKFRVNPFGDPESPSGQGFPLGHGGKRLHERWRAARAQGHSLSETPHPFRLQIGRVFTYQLFLEQSMSLLSKEGRLGLLVPSGIYSDAWSRPLRENLLDRCRWDWLFGMENREGIFPIHRSYKFSVIVAQKGGRTTTVHGRLLAHEDR